MLRSRGTKQIAICDPVSFFFFSKYLRRRLSIRSEQTPLQLPSIRRPDTFHTCKKSLLNGAKAVDDAFKYRSRDMHLHRHLLQRVVWRRWPLGEGNRRPKWGHAAMAEPRQFTSRGWAYVILALAVVLARGWHCPSCHTAAQAKESYKCLAIASCSTSTAASSLPFPYLSRAHPPTGFPLPAPSTAPSIAAATSRSTTAPPRTCP